MGQHDLDAEICSSPLISSRVSVQAPFRNPLAVDFQQMVDGGGADSCGCEG